jgi:hypothetical protein
MAVDLSHGNESMDYAEHEHTYAAFVKLVKYGTLSVVILLLMMASFLL